MKALCLFYIIIFPYHAMADDLQDLKTQKIISFFRASGAQVLNELSEKFTDINYEDKSISIVELRLVLKNANIVVQYEDLIDNTGSIVDAIGTPGKVILDGRRWIEFTKGLRSTNLLVFHEILRMAKINDDDFRHSRQYLPTLQSGIEVAPYCNLRIQTTTVKVTSKNFSGEGFSTPISGVVFILSGNSDRSIEAQSNAHKDLEENCQKKGYENPENITGNISVINSNTNGLRKNLYKASLKGTCYKKELIKRSVDEQKNEICHKINLCHNLFSEGQKSYYENVIIMDQLIKKWGCR